MGELKNRGREGIKEGQDNYREIQEKSQEELEERDRNREIIINVEPVDDDDKAAVETGKSKGKEIADQIAQSTMDAPKNEVNTNMEGIITEMDGYKEREEEEMGKVSAMDGNYGGVGSNLENKFQESANEFNEIVTSGREIKEGSNENINSIIENMKMDW